MWKEFIDEITCLFTDRRTLMVILGLPLVVTLFFGYLYINHKVKELPVVVLDQDNSSLSRETITAFNISEKFTVAGRAASPAQVEEYLRRGRAMAAIIIPHNFARDIKTGQGTEVLIIADGSNMIISNTIATGAVEVVGTLSAGIQVRHLEGKGMARDQAEDLVSAVSFRSRVWYNPTYNYLKFLLPGLIVMGIQQSLFISVALALFRSGKSAVGKDKSIPELVSFLTGRIVPYVLLGTASLLFCLALAHVLFNLSVSNFPAVAVLGLIFCLGTAGLGAVSALLSPTLDFAIQLAMVIAAPAFLISGFTWPMLVIPQPIQMLAFMLPLTHFLDALRAVTMKGAGLGDVTQQLQALLFLACLMPVLAVSATFPLKLMKSRSGGE